MEIDRAAAQLTGVGFERRVQVLIPVRPEPDEQDSFEHWFELLQPRFGAKAHGSCRLYHRSDHLVVEAPVERLGEALEHLDHAAAAVHQPWLQKREKRGTAKKEAEKALQAWQERT